MRPTKFYRWWITTPETGKRQRTSWRMSRDEAVKHDPNAEPDLGSLEVRRLPDSPDEWNVARRRSRPTHAYEVL
jgi:hypothetical protein